MKVSVGNLMFAAAAVARPEAKERRCRTGRKGRDEWKESESYRMRSGERIKEDLQT